MNPPIRIYSEITCHDCRYIEELAALLGFVKHKDFVIRAMAWLTNMMSDEVDWCTKDLGTDIGCWASMGMPCLAPFVIIKSNLPHDNNLRGYAGKHDAENGLRAFVASGCRLPAGTVGSLDREHP